MLDWLIVGGGIHGTYLSNHLLKAANANPDKLRVVDPHEAPLAVWKRCTQSTCMKYLRSPGQHNLDVGTGALFRFGLSHANRSEFYSKYQRPTLSLFNAHCDHVIESGSLSHVRVKASALNLERRSASYVLSTTDGEMESKRIILCVGGADCLSIPVWANNLLSAAAPIAHIFSSDFVTARNKEWSRAVIIGGGISAAQLALSLSKERPGQVLMLHSRRLQTYQFDADPCWLDGSCLRVLRRQHDFVERRRIVDGARHWGSFPEEVRRQLELAVKKETLSCVQDSVASATGNSDSIRLNLASGDSIESDLVVLATGFARCVPGGEFLQSAIDGLDLPCAPCGYPIVDECLRWSEDLFVTGPLAELVIGPASRNIVGARLAAERIVRAEKPRRHRPKELEYHYFKRKRTG